MIDPQALWIFKYPPKNIEEMIVDEPTKEILKKALVEVPNILLSGPPGVGKGTYADILIKETGYDCLKINASDENSVDDMRNKVKSFATSLGFSDFKLVYLNEADWITPNGQGLLRDLIESVQAHTRFIFAVNYPHKLIPELHSRCQHIKLGNPPADKIFERIMMILKQEKIKIENKSAIVDTIKTCYPDIRKIINEIQKNVVNNTLGTFKVSRGDEIYENIFSSLLNMKFDEIRFSLRSNSIHYEELYKYIFENIDKMNNCGEAICIVGQYLYRDSFVAIKEINFLAMCWMLNKAGCIK